MDSPHACFRRQKETVSSNKKSAKAPNVLPNIGMHVMILNEEGGSIDVLHIFSLMGENAKKHLYVRIFSAID